jgi:hypothetical protein
MRMPYASAGLPRQDFVLARNDKPSKETEKEISVRDFLPSLEGKFLNVCLFSGMFQGHRHQVARAIQVKVHVLRNLTRFHHFSIRKMDKGGVRIFKVVDFHWFPFFE